ncbi:DUF5668 domain-containing protein [Fulvivirga sp.]|uniref:LiaF transmembrane domain-containing protein n=1 Tax=Fulvivirga sp. TaxID=1931237 RepID=UPI0032F00649
MGNENISDRRFWLGLIFVGIGAVLLLDNLDILPYWVSDLVISWRMLLVFIGTYIVVGKKKPEGFILIIIGGLFLVQDFYYFRMRDIWHILWPAVFIAIGVSLLLRRNRSKEVADGEKKNEIDYVDDFAVFGGREIVVDSQNFRGGKLSAMFGGSSVDLRNANLSEGENVLDILAIFGGTSIIVPQDWTIKVDVTSVLGGFSDQRTSTVKVMSHPNKVLIIKGFVMFGGGDIKYNK